MVLCTSRGRGGTTLSVRWGRHLSIPNHLTRFQQRAIFWARALAFGSCSCMECGAKFYQYPARQSNACHWRLHICTTEGCGRTGCKVQAYASSPRWSGKSNSYTRGRCHCGRQEGRSRALVSQVECVEQLSSVSCHLRGLFGMGHITTANGSRQLMFLITTGVLLLLSTITVIIR